jgi:hypothetical protein
LSQRFYGVLIGSVERDSAVTIARISGYLSVLKFKRKRGDSRVILRTASEC